MAPIRLLKSLYLSQRREYHDLQNIMQSSTNIFPVLCDKDIKANTWMSSNTYSYSSRNAHIIGSIDPLCYQSLGSNMDE